MPIAAALEQLEQLELLAVIRARGIAERRADAAIRLGDARRRATARSSMPHSRARLRVQVRGERLGQPVGERLDHDRAVVVVLALEAAAPASSAPMPGRHGERAEVVGDGRSPRGAMKSASDRFGLPSAIASCCRSMLNRASSPRARDRRCRRRCRRRRSPRARSRRRRARVSSLLVDDALEQRLRVLVQLARRRAVLRMVEDRREASLQLPRREEERPVDVRHELLERHVVEHAAADERRRRAACSRAQSICSRLASAASYGSSGRSLARAVLLAQPLLLRRGSSRSNAGAPLVAQQARHDVDHARRVEHVHGRPACTPARSSPPCAAGSSSRRRSAAAA